MQQTRALRLLCRPPQIPICLRLPCMLSYSSSRSSWWEWYTVARLCCSYRVLRPFKVPPPSLPPPSLPFGITHHPSHLFHLRQPRFHKQMGRGEGGWPRWPRPRPRSPQDRANDHQTRSIHQFVRQQRKTKMMIGRFPSRVDFFIRPRCERASNLSSPVVQKRRAALQRTQCFNLRRQRVARIPDL